ncbi:Acylphosphatase-like [Penicillium camemberti]|uniref:acylphosphatase n=1 Tax=Penicillium camemberti (strain FM 013) TaxID=1429867 RepID=A0A0G4PVI1_PENC3|nr:Acylphosphatase-like [Penicillium camemberti]
MSNIRPAARQEPQVSPTDILSTPGCFQSPRHRSRDFTQKCAKLDGLKGWVRNTTCGRVEGEAQGSDEKVKKFLQRIDKGPSMAHVVKLEKRDLDVRDDEEGFAVMRTAESMFKPGN